jgi:hypothetical protein
MGNAFGGSSAGNTVTVLTQGNVCGGKVIFQNAPSPLLVPGIVSLEEWNQKIGEASEMLARFKSNQLKMILGVFGSFFLLQVFIFSSESTTYGGLFPFLVVPMIFYICQVQKKAQADIQNVFASWNQRGITTTFWPGSKHSPASLNFTIPPQLAAQAAQMQQQNMQQFAAWQQGQMQQNQQQVYGQPQQPPMGMPPMGSSAYANPAVGADPNGTQFSAPPQFGAQPQYGAPLQYGAPPQYAAPLPYGQPVDATAYAMPVYGQPVAGGAAAVAVVVPEEPRKY